MHNESLADRESEPIKPSKLQRIKSAALVAGFYGTCAAVTGGSIYAGLKMTKMQLETARLNLEAAKIAKQ